MPHCRCLLQVFLPAEHDAWTLLAIDLQALARQSSRSPLACLRALQVGCRRQARGAVWHSRPLCLVGATWSFLTSSICVPVLPSRSCAPTCTCGWPSHQT